MYCVVGLLLLFVLFLRAPGTHHGPSASRMEDREVARAGRDRTGLRMGCKISPEENNNVRVLPSFQQPACQKLTNINDCPIPSSSAVLLFQVDV